MQLHSWLGSYVRHATVALPGNAYISAAVHLVAGAGASSIVFKRASNLFEWPNDADALVVTPLGEDLTDGDIWRVFQLWFLLPHPTASTGDLILCFETAGGAQHSYFSQDGGLSWLATTSQ